MVPELASTSSRVADTLGLRGPRARLRGHHRLVRALPAEALLELLRLERLPRLREARGVRDQVHVARAHLQRGGGVRGVRSRAFGAPCCVSQCVR